MWSEIAVGDLVDSGDAEITTGPFGTQLKAAEYVDRGWPVINVRNVGMGEVRRDNIEFVDELKAAELSRHRLLAGDIVFGRKGAVERHALIGVGESGWVQGSDCIRLRIDPSRFRPTFASYVLRTEWHQQWMKNLCAFGATMASLNQDIVRLIMMPDVPLELQDKIVRLLGAFDGLIENNRRRIEILEEMARSLYREWFVHFRYPGHEGVEMVDSELGPIPVGWQVSSFADIAEFINGFAFKPGEHWQTQGLPIIKIKELKAGVSPDTPRNNGADIPQKYFVEDRDVLFSWSADLDAYVWSGGPALLNQHLFVVRPFELPRLFVFHLLEAQMHMFRSRAQGTTMKHIKRSALSEVATIVPATSLIDAFLAVAEPMRDLQINLAQQNRVLRGARDLLLPRLVSGELDVSDLDLDGVLA